jgi:small neutral amino acid transporter SnatA (MarC family)
MILNEEQQQELQKELNYAVKYRETYDEVYDHLVSAIEQVADDKGADVATLAKHIIDDEFGGYDALKAMERDRVKLMNFAMRKKHFQHMFQFFNLPVVGFTAIITVAAYFLAANPVSRRYLLEFTTASAVVPMLFLLYKKLSDKFKQWQFDIYKKQSIKDNYIFIAALLSNSTFNLLNIANHRIQMNGGVCIFIFVFYVVYVLSFFRLYRDEFKMQLT